MKQSSSEVSSSLQSSLSRKIGPLFCPYSDPKKGVAPIEKCESPYQVTSVLLRMEVTLEPSQLDSHREPSAIGVYVITEIRSVV